MIVTTRNRAPTFTSQLWITGAANFTDSSPNSVAPDPATRVITTPAGIIVTPGTGVGLFLVDGTSASIRFWWYDDGHSIWIPAGNVQALTYAAVSAASATVGCMPGAKWFAQFTANTGVTKASFFIR
jgi:hypothetical protein